MPPMLLQMLPFLAQGISGLFQGGKGVAGLLGSNRPQYSIPAAQQQSLALAQAQAGGDMAGYGQAKSNIGTSTANALGAARESGNPLAAISAIQANQNQAFNNLDTQNANYKVGRQDNLQRALGTQGEYQDRAFQMNEFAPYMDKQRESRQLIGSGLSNVFGAMNNATAFDTYSNLLKGVNTTTNINATLGGQGGGSANGGIGGIDQLKSVFGNNQGLFNMMKNNPLLKVRQLGE